MKYYDDSTPTIRTVTAKDKNGKVRTDSNGDAIRKLSFSFNWKSAIASLAFLLFVGKAGAFYFQTNKAIQDTVKVQKVNEARLDTLEIEATANREASMELQSEILRIIAPEKAESIISRIEKKRSTKILEQKEKASRKRGNI